MDRPRWALESGVPSAHVARAALHVASMLDLRGSKLDDARESYWHHATGGTFPPPDLQMGERLLVDCGLVIERDRQLFPAPDLEDLLDGAFEDALATLAVRALESTARSGNTELSTAEALQESLTELVPDPDRREELILALGRRFDDRYRRIVGEIAEEIVVAAARAELVGLGYLDLSRQVRRVSLESDQLGYDVTAPRVSGPRRLLEVKGTTRDPSEDLAIHLSRNEAETGLQFDEWALVVCHVTNVDLQEGDIVGWLMGRDLEGTLPSDVADGRWEQAEISVAGARLRPGFPSAVL
jgi:hypothetical protein